MGTPEPPVPHVLPHVLAVCRTCHRYAAHGSGEPTPGERLADRLAALLAAEGLDDRLTLRRVECLSGCRSPCTVSLTAGTKARLRLGRLGPGDAERIVTLARAYADSPAGAVPDALGRAGLDRHVTSLAPPRPPS